MWLEYAEDGSVSASVKLQELFGLPQSPEMGPNRVPVTFHLLAPNGRPVQTTRDLRGFWQRTYPEVRRELRAVSQASVAGGSMDGAPHAPHAKTEERGDAGYVQDNQDGRAGGIASSPPPSMIVHLVDGTYSSFATSTEQRRDTPGDRPFSAVQGVLGTIAQMIEGGATHIGVATDHVIESFRNDLWPGYKTGEGIDPALLAQFHPLEDALVAMGVATWPMVQLEADDALASAAHLAGADTRVLKVCIWTPDKDLSQCVVGERVVQIDRKSGRIRNEEGVLQKFGVAPPFIPDYLALVGDASDGFPGIAGIGAENSRQTHQSARPYRRVPVDVWATTGTCIAVQASGNAANRCAPVRGRSNSCGGGAATEAFAPMAARSAAGWLGL